MPDSSQKRITPRAENYSQWYLDVIESAGLAEHSVVKGCMVIKPYGYAIWENIQKILDAEFKKTGHENAYFPLFIPKSFLSREAEHVEGFAKECAVVTHHRLKNDSSGAGVVVDPAAKLEEELVVRPTSETIIHDTMSRWIQSWRDLPLLLNQWANIVRWEMRTRLFLRTTEFLWQEGHTAHENEEQAEEETMKMLEVYKKFAQDCLALPVISGQKSEREKFAGALRTYAIEAMMQDGKALQAGTSHNLGQNFAKVFQIRYLDRAGQLQHVWQTSWGVSTRLIGALIMGHSDDKGLVLPPKIAPIKVVIVPIWKSEEEREKVLKAALRLKEALSEISPELGVFGAVRLDDRDHLTPGHKFHEWEKKGVPVRLELGPKDIEKNAVVIVRRDTGEKKAILQSDAPSEVLNLLSEIQGALFQKASDFLVSHSRKIDHYEEFKAFFSGDGGFAYSHLCDSPDCETKISEETLATVRCIPFEQKEETGTCILCGKPAEKRAVFAKAY
ncbi:proline--tRNA ligase [Candidatus Peregrinibacteria bacterium]|nr:proline--tRNA ligase [Candidatus Peregrinibacteria bacterium]